MRTLRPGTRVCSIPFLVRPEPQLVGYSNETPGGYAEYMRLTEMLLLEVPNGLSPQHAALTEPMAVGLHAVEMARLDRNDVPLVIGCGPVGLAVIAALRLRDARPIVAADFSPRRRELAAAVGADIVVDPAARSPYESWQEVAVWQGGDPPMLMPWEPGPPLRPAVVFECVGVPGVIHQIMTSAAPKARIVVVGVCMERDNIEPMFGINKELNVQFVLAYTPEEFMRTLYALAEGKDPRRGAHHRPRRRRRRAEGVRRPGLTRAAREDPRRALAPLRTPRRGFSAREARGRAPARRGTESPLWFTDPASP
jgi:threonine dehydrogenase-like Zn-dependent dehydrogenase